MEIVEIYSTIFNILLKTMPFDDDNKHQCYLEYGWMLDPSEHSVKKTSQNLWIDLINILLKESDDNGSSRLTSKKPSYANRDGRFLSDFEVNLILEVILHFSCGFYCEVGDDCNEGTIKNEFTQSKYSEIVRQVERLLGGRCRSSDDQSNVELDELKEYYQYLTGKGTTYDPRVDPRCSDEPWYDETMSAEFAPFDKKDVPKVLEALCYGHFKGNWENMVEYIQSRMTGRRDEQKAIKKQKSLLDFVDFE